MGASFRASLTWILASTAKIHSTKKMRTDGRTAFQLYIVDYRSHSFSIKPSINTAKRILAKDAILKREQLSAHVKHDYGSDVENICQ